MELKSRAFKFRDLLFPASLRRALLHSFYFARFPRKSHSLSYDRYGNRTRDTRFCTPQTHFSPGIEASRLHNCRMCNSCVRTCASSASEVPRCSRDGTTCPSCLRAAARRGLISRAFARENSAAREISNGVARRRKIWHGISGSGGLGIFEGRPPCHTAKAGNYAKRPQATLAGVLLRVHYATRNAIKRVTR